MTITDLLQHIHSGMLPLHIAVDLAVPGALDHEWKAAAQFEIMEMLVMTRRNALLDGLEAIARVMDRGGELARFIPVERGRIGWPINATVTNLWVLVGGDGVAWRAIRALGPPTLEEIVRATEMRAAR